MAEAPCLDEVDLDLVAALQHAPRAPFDVLARAIGVSARTVTRRYTRLVEDDLLRVICELDWSLLAEGVPVNVWLDTEPGASHEVATALAARTDTTFVSICSGRGDVYTVLHGMTRKATTTALTTELPRIAGIRSIRSEWVLRRLTSSAAWRLPRLGKEQRTALSDHSITERGQRHQELDPLERNLAELLRTDARTPYSEIARSLEITESRARRTATALFDSGMLRPRVEIDPHQLGYQTEVVLSISCPPHAADELTTTLRTHPATRFLGLVAAKPTLTWDGVFHNEDELADFLTADIGSHQAVTALECSFHLNIAKRYWTSTRT
ncbi:Lrp/AsnC family transcriptional regulator [Sciscionella sediminilitoris]|uniref:Lrp/AsnC family transcriptional regulator n=1 Tax=Sciscionella sediminilitoris TaxID=1445613 RepID=UPI0004DF82BE|nr:Lrp/AsnC family transcriptional regulator [Sciscionella sp. SE31]